MFIKTFLRFFIVLWITIGSINSAPGSNIPKKLLNVPITLTTGEILTLNDFKGKQPVYLKFWATWCQPCMQQMPHFQQIQEKYGKEVQVIAINLAVNDQLKDVLKVSNKFNLTMPISLDKSGDLAQNFHLLGTPYHLLFDRQINLVHVTNDSDKALTNKIELLTKNQPLKHLNEQSFYSSEMKPINFGTSTQAILFTATWCDWYFAQTRAEMATGCINAQNLLNRLAKQLPNIEISGQLSRLWTDDNAMKKYRQRFNIKHPLFIDKSNQYFHQLAIKNIPTLVLIKNGKVIKKITDFENANTILSELSTLQ
mgnify:CR=1 FL=1